MKIVVIFVFLNIIFSAAFFALGNNFAGSSFLISGFVPGAFLGMLLYLDADLFNKIKDF